MTQSTRAALKAYADANLNTNGAHGITGAELNAFSNDIADSAILQQPFGTLASAATVTLANASSNFVSITGTTTITSFGVAPSGMVRIVLFDQPLTLVHSSSIKLPGNANIAVGNNDIACFFSDPGASEWRCLWYLRKTGKPVVAPAWSDLTGSQPAPIAHVHSAADLTSGTVPDARISGNYTGLGHITQSGDLVNTSLDWRFRMSTTDGADNARMILYPTGGAGNSRGPSIWMSGNEYGGDATIGAGELFLRAGDAGLITLSSALSGVDLLGDLRITLDLDVSGGLGVGGDAVLDGHLDVASDDLDGSAGTIIAARLVLTSAHDASAVSTLHALQIGDPLIDQAILIDRNEILHFDGGVLSMLQLGGGADVLITGVTHAFGGLQVQSGNVNFDMELDVVGDTRLGAVLDVVGNATIGGSLTLINDLAVSEGGTGASTAAAARLNLEAVGYTTGSATGIIDFPIGQILWVVNKLAARPRRGSVTVTLHSDTECYEDAGAGTALSGTWRSIGASATANTTGGYLAQRVA